MKKRKALPNRRVKRDGRVPLREIRAIARRIAEKFDVQKIILFGSYAYGKPRRYSDVDLLVLMETKKRPIRQSLEILKSLSPLDFSIDLIVKREADIERRIPLGDFFLQDIVQKGKVLYEK